MKKQRTWTEMSSNRTIEYANQVRAGEYGEVVKEWQAHDSGPEAMCKGEVIHVIPACGDGVMVPHFVVLVPGAGPLLFDAVTLKANESGVFGKLITGEWINCAPDATKGSACSEYKLKPVNGVGHEI